MDEAIVNPIRGKHAPNLGKTAVMVSSRPDLALLVKQIGMAKGKSCDLLMSRLYTGEGDFRDVCVAGPFIGAPYATILMENLIARGVEKIIFFGWCGAVSPRVKTGDIVLAKSSVVDEGTSPHYMENRTRKDAKASIGLTAIIENALVQRRLNYHCGRIWTTDAIFRETRQQVKAHMDEGVLAVEMELSAVFSVGDFRGVETAGILAVSDELSSLDWKPGFGDKRFKRARGQIITLLSDICTI